MKIIYIAQIYLMSMLSIFAQSNITLSKLNSINEKEDTLIFQISGFTLDDSGFIYICDRMDYKIKKFNFEGKLIDNVGRRGEGPNEFRLGPVKICFDKVNKRIAVVDHTTPFIKLFTEDLEYLNFISAPMAVVDIDFDNLGRLWVCTVPLTDEIKSVFVYDQNLQKILEFNPTNQLKNTLLNTFFLENNERTQQILLMYRYRNLIQCYDYNWHLIREIKLNNFPEQSELSTQIVFGQQLPSQDILWDISTDTKGNIYLIGGEFSFNERRDIYKLSAKGILLSEITLNEKTSYIGFDDEENLYVSEKENIILTKYMIMNELSE